MIKMQNIQLLIGGKALLDAASITLHAGHHYGLVGRNGTGKTSLFKLLLRLVKPDSGELSISKHLRISHMAQEIDNVTTNALDYVLDGDTLFRQAQANIAKAQDENSDSLLVQAWAEYEQVDGYTAENRAQQLLQGLGFQKHQWQQPVASFSGGWRVRLSLAQALMCPSDVLLLDEPTNHLDLDAAFWLESWLKRYEGMLLLVSHDRDFLDQVVETIVYLDQKQLTSYRGNYAAFERQKAERMAQQQSLFNKQQTEIAHIESFIQRFRAKASKAKQAQGRLKALERMEKIAPAYADSPFTFRFPEFDQTSSSLLSLNHAELGYNSPLLKANVGILSDSRIALLGPNGAGKSTLIKSLVGDLDLLFGERICGEHLRIGYFAQHQLEAMDINASGLLHLQRIKPQASDQELRDFLGGFGWQGDRVFDSVGNFSGGEKVRLALAMIAIQKPNLLLLDEPTNHLDIEARHGLTMALQAYNGALILISHDRHLVRQVTENYWLVADNKVQMYEGDLDSYQRQLQQLVQKQASHSSVTETPHLVENLDEAQQKEQKEGAGAAEIKLTSQQHKQKKREAAEKRAKLSPLKKHITQLEKNLEIAQEKMGTIETQLASADIYHADNHNKLQQLLIQRGELQTQIDTNEEQWLTSLDELEQLQNQ